MLGLSKISRLSPRFIRIRKYHKPSYFHNPGTEPLHYLTIGKVLEEASQKYGDRLAIIARGQKTSLSFKDVLDQADRLAAGFRTIGLDIGDRVGIWAPNTIEWFITHMACARGGFVLVNMNPAYQPLEVQYCINKVGIKCIICPSKFKSQDNYEILNQMAPEISQSEQGKLQCKEVPSLKNIVVCGDETLSGTFKYDQVLDLATKNGMEDIRKLQDDIDPDSMCHIQFTSGTTGKPKCPIQTHFHLVNNAYFAGKRTELNSKHHKICLQVPFFHAFGTVLSVNASITYGSTLVLPDSVYNPDKSLDAIRDEKCSIIYGTPTMYVDLIKAQKKRKEDIHPEIALCGGAPCSPQLFTQMMEVLNVKKVRSLYGLTETTASTFQSMTQDDEHHSTTTVGYIQEHIEAKVIDEEGRIVPMGTPGELCIRGYNTTLGYWQDDEKTKELIGADKWLKTGDQFVLEENGYGRVVGRLKEMIIRGGENIFPKEIEDFLNTHPDILEAHVIGLPHERLGEEVCACIRVRENTTLTLNDIKAFCKGKIAHFKTPSVLKIVDSFPKTMSGKIQKFMLVKNISGSK